MPESVFECPFSLTAFVKAGPAFKPIAAKPAAFERDRTKRSLLLPADVGNQV